MDPLHDEPELPTNPTNDQRTSIFQNNYSKTLKKVFQDLNLPKSQKHLKINE